MKTKYLFKYPEL